MGDAALWFSDFASLTAVLALGSVVFFWITRYRREAGPIHDGLFLAWLATASGVRWSIGDLAAGIVLGWLALASALDGLIFCGLRRVGPEARGVGVFFLAPLRDMGIVLAASAFCAWRSLGRSG